jgi:hypothetical protein
MGDFPYFPGGESRPADELNVRDCSSCGRPTVFAKGSRAGICANCAPAPIVEAERSRNCPLDGTSMVSHRRSDIIVDQCPSCQGVWLGSDEVGLIIAATRAFASGQSEKAAEFVVNILSGSVPPKRAR